MAYIAVTALAFPHPAAGFVLDAGWLLAWFSPLLLLLGVRGLPPRAAARRGFLLGLLAHAAILHFITITTVRYGGAPLWVGMLAPLAMACYPAAASALFCAGAAWLKGRVPAPAFALAALWVTLDHARSFVLSGFPWATLGYAQHENAALLGLTAWTGVYGLSFATVLVAALLLPAARGGGPRPASFPGWRAALLRAGAALLVLHLLGVLLAPPRGAGPSLRVAVLQGNIEQGVKWSPDWAERTISIYQALARRAAAQGAELIVFPETAVPGSLDAPELLARFAALSRETGAKLVVGAVGLSIAPPGSAAEQPYLYHDSSFSFTPEDGLVERYDKTHLVPFGEYLPLRAVLERVIEPLARGISNLDLTPGATVRAITLPGEPPLRVATPICYELLFPDLVRRMSKDGAELLLGITNDAWYGATGAPYQFLAMTALRSAENGIWTARAANTGVSAFIDERGRVRAQTKIFERGLLVADVPLRRPGSTPTFYARRGDWFAFACWLATAGFAALALRTRRT